MLDGYVLFVLTSCRKEPTGDPIDPTVTHYK